MSEVLGLVGFVAQISLVVILIQAVLPLWLSAMTPLHVYSVEAMGPRTAMGVMALVTVSFVHGVGALLTVPAVMGLKCGKIQINKVATLREVMKSMPLVTVNFLLTVAWAGFGGFYLADEKSLYDLRAGIPSHGVLSFQAALSLVAFECVFYHVHRLFHQNKWLYKKVHKIHHTWTAPVALASTYAHPVEHILSNLTSLSAGPLLCGAHPAVLMSFALLFGLGVNMHHCGYWTEDLGMHDLHHEAFNVNFGNAHILDMLYGTYRSHRRLAVTKESQA